MIYQINLADLGAVLIFLAALCVARNELLKKYVCSSILVCSKAV